MPDIFDKAPAAVEDMLNDIPKFKAIVTDAVDDGVRSALRAIKQGRNAADDAIHDAKRAVRTNPIQSMGIVFAIGVLTGSLVAWLGSRRA